MYIGDLVQNKRNKVNYKVKKIIKNNPENYIVVENTHEPIIEKEIFYKVQKRIPKNVGRNEKKETHLLDGLLYCGDCGHRISVASRRKKDNRCYTICNYYRTYMKYHVCTTHSNNYDVLEKDILNTLKELCLNYIDKKKIKEETLKNINEDGKKNIKKEISFLETEINNINNNLDNIYIDKLNKVITEEQFNRVKNKLENELKIKQNRHMELISDVNEKSNNETNHKKIDKFIDELLSMEKFNRELIVNLVDRIEIFEDKKINIKVSFDNSN